MAAGGSTTPTPYQPDIHFIDYVGPITIAVIAVVILLIWAGTTIYLLSAATCCTNSGDDRPRITEQLVTINTATGGLVSALVIAIISVSSFPNNPAKYYAAVSDNTEKQLSDTGLSAQDRYLLNKKKTRAQRTYVAYVVIFGLYAIVWVVLGLAALVVGVLFFPDGNQTLNSFGVTWLGYVVAALSAAFGLRPLGTNHQSG